MTSRSDEQGSYEGVLAASDTRTRRASIVVALIGSVGVSLYFRTVHVYGLVAVLVAWGLISDLLGGKQKTRMGYEIRGAAQSRGVVEWLACLIVLGVAFLIQSEFSLWFAQEALCRRCA